MSDPAAFDSYGDTYASAVQESVAFSGLSYDYFLRSKAILIRRLLARRLADVTAPRLLDVGCGVGALHPLLRPLFGQVTGVDVSAECLARAAAAHPWARYDRYDGARLPAADEHFDMVTAICVAHHVPVAERPGFFAELRRVTAPGGLVCVIEHNPFNPATRLSVMRCPFDHDAVLLRRREAEARLRAAGTGEVTGEFFVAVPSTAAWALKVEGVLAQVPLGAQYAAYGTA